MKNEIDYRDGIKIKDRKESWPDKCQLCGGNAGKILLSKWRVICDIKEDPAYELRVTEKTKKLLCFDIIKQGKGEEEVEALIGTTDIFIFFVCSKSCAQKLHESLYEDRRFMDLAEKMLIANVEKEPVRLEFECELCGKRFWVKWRDDIPKKGDIVRLTCPNCRNNGVKFIRTYEEYEH